MTNEYVIEADRFWPDSSGTNTVGVREGILIPAENLDAPETISFGNGWIVATPGWVNAHAHLELSAAPEIEYSGDFIDWIYGVLEFKRDQSREEIREAYEQGADRLLESGIAHVLDHCDLTGWIMDVANNHVLDVRPLKEMIAFPPDQREEMSGDAKEFLERARDIGLKAGLAPHAPYSAHPELYHRARELVDQFDGIFSSHLHEILPELSFTEKSEGRFQDLLNDRTGTTTESPWTERPVAQLCREGIYDRPGLAVHLNHLTESDLRWIEGHQLYPVFCPRSYEYFRHDTEPYRHWIEREIPFCLGTDSIASNEGLNMLDELQTLAEWIPGAPPETILKSLTIYPTRVMGEPGRGVLTWGTPADLSIFEVPGEDPLAELARGDAIPRAVVLNGEPIHIERSY